MTVPITFYGDDFERWGTGTHTLVKGTEVDRNFWELKAAIEDLIENPPSPIQIASFTVAGATFSIHMTNGNIVGPMPLPVLTWRWRDAWTPTTPYLVLDVFSVEGVGIFLVLIDHTSAGSFDPNALSGGDPLYRQLFGWEPATKEDAISAAGTDQAGATPLTADWNVVSTVGSGAGVALRAASTSGRAQWVFNADSTDDLLVYPMDGDSAKINAQSTDAPFTIPANSGAEFRPMSATQWYSAS